MVDTALRSEGEVIHPVGLDRRVDRLLAEVVARCLHPRRIDS
jgi:hypothetical protein